MKNGLYTDKKTGLDAINLTPPCLTICQEFEKIKSLISLVTFLLLPALAYAQDSTTHFVLKVTTNPSVNAEDATFIFYSQDTVYMVDWGEGGGFERVTIGDVFHTFASVGVHTIRFKNLNDVKIDRQAGATKYTSIEQWGTFAWNADMGDAFEGAINLTMHPDAGTPDMSVVTNMSSMFHGATSFNGDISRWNTAKVTNMRDMFNGATSFNRDIDGWNTAEVTNMSSMFNGAASFDQDIGGWNVRKVRVMAWMFLGATSFDQDIGGWNIASVTSMSSMFSRAIAFSQNLGPWYIRDGELTMSSTIMAGDTVAIITAQNAFLTRHNPVYTLSGTDANFFTLTGNVLTRNATVATVGRPSYTISIASTGAFGTNNRREVTITLNEAGSATNFITTWRTTTANESITIPTTGTGYNYTVHWGDGSSESGKTGDATHTYTNTGDYTVSIGGVFPRIYFNNGDHKTKIRDVTQWGDIAWTSMTGAFQGANNLAVTATDAPDLSGVTNMSWMFQNATSFNGDIRNWNTEQVTDMQYMFSGASSFNSDIGGWNTAKVGSMGSMFSRATAFNQDIGGWNTAKVGSMGNMFSRATSFNQNIGGWNVEAVWSMGGLFNVATLSVANYDALLVGWNRQTLRPARHFDGGGSKYSSNAAHTARGNMINSDNWAIIDGGRVQTDDAPKNIFLSSTSITENAGANAVVGMLSTNGGASSYTYALVAGTGATDNTSFWISDTELQLISSADYETKPSYSVRIKASDGTNDVEKSFNIYVDDIPRLSIMGDRTVSMAEGDIAVITLRVVADPPLQTVTFTLLGADSGLFSITSEGVLTFKVAPDYENPVDTGTDNMYEVTITATDNGTPEKMVMHALTITVTDVNEHAPVFAGGPTATVAYEENDPTEVTVVIATDADAGQTVTFMLSGGADAGLFSITPAGVLTFKVAPDYENPVDTGTDNVYEVTITATDNGTPEMTAMQALTIMVTDVVPTELEAFTGIAVYPNPAGVALHISGVVGNARYTLSGIDGKVLKKGKLKEAGRESHSVAIPSLNKGIYLLHITTGKSSVTRKIVKD